MAHKLPPLRFGYDALEPYIDAETMELHHDKHHKAYVDNLNKALEPYPQLAELAVEDLLHRLDQVPETIRTAVRNNGGGHLNHQFFWDIRRTSRERGVEGRDRRSHQERLRARRVNFSHVHTNAAITHFGSGWAFLDVNPSRRRLAPEWMRTGDRCGPDVGPPRLR